MPVEKAVGNCGDGTLPAASEVPDCRGHRIRASGPPTAKLHDPMKANPMLVVESLVGDIDVPQPVS